MLLYYFLKKILKKPLKNLPLYPEMNEFDQISLMFDKNGKTVTKFHSFFSFFTLNSYWNTHD